MNSIGIVGLGTIGIKLIEYFAEKGFDVIAFNYKNIDEKRSQFRANLEKKIRFDKVSLESLELIERRVSFSNQLADMSGTTLVIESLKEEYAVKTSFFKELGRINLSRDTLIATTTSSLSLTKIASDSGTASLVGLHFFNPPTRMKLIELAFTPAFPSESKNKLHDILNLLDDKIIIEMPPIQGFIVNRILFSYINFATQFMRENSFDPITVDRAMKMGTNVPMGPLELSDYIGNDVSLQILRQFYDSLADNRYSPDPFLIELVNAGKLGKKSGEGFYKY